MRHGGDELIFSAIELTQFGVGFLKVALGPFTSCRQKADTERNGGENHELHEIVGIELQLPGDQVVEIVRGEDCRSRGNQCRAESAHERGDDDGQQKRRVAMRLQLGREKNIQQKRGAHRGE